MRHGVEPTQPSSAEDEKTADTAASVSSSAPARASTVQLPEDNLDQRLACYFCSDVVAPRDVRIRCLVIVLQFSVSLPVVKRRIRFPLVKTSASYLVTMRSRGSSYRSFGSCVCCNLCVGNDMFLMRLFCCAIAASYEEPHVPFSGFVYVSV